MPWDSSPQEAAVEAARLAGQSIFPSENDDLEGCECHALFEAPKEGEVRFIVA